MTIALATLANGARGATREAIMGVLGLPAGELDALNQACAGVWNHLERLDPKTDEERRFGKKGVIPNVVADLANGLWLNESLPFEAAFVEMVRQTYQAEVTGIAMNQDAVERINHWVSERTAGNIDKLIDRVDHTTTMVLTNAVYFKGAWAAPFKLEATREAQFLLADGTSIPCDMMHQSTAFLYAENEILQLVALPFSGSRLPMDRAGASLLIALPRPTYSVNDALVALGSDWRQSIRAMAQASRAGDVYLSLPRFRIAARTDMQACLNVLGMGLAFDPGQADFTALTPIRPTWLSEAVHAATLLVNERGAIAAAATAFSAMALGISNTIEMRVDRPFLCALVLNADWTPLFVGAIQRPERVAAEPLPPGIDAIAPSFPPPHRAPQPSPEEAVGLHASSKDFGVRLLRDLLQRTPGENVFVSPLSMTIALAALANGAKGATREAIMHVLGLPAREPAAINQACTSVLNRLQQLDEDRKFGKKDALIASAEFANGIWLPAGMPFESSFSTPMGQVYTYERAVPNDAVVLANTLYFKGNWGSPFKRERTTEAMFQLADGSRVACDLMQHSEVFLYVETDTFQLVALPFFGQSPKEAKRVADLVIVLPRPGRSFAEVLAGLGTDWWQSVEELKPTYTTLVNLALPRFRIQAHSQLQASLATLGMAVACDARQADFTTLTSTRPAWLSAVDHAALFTVNEEDRKLLWALTAKRKVEMRVDRPFMCAVMLNPGWAPLFIGAIQHPERVAA